MRQWIPQKSNQTARNLILLLFGGAFALLAITTLMGDYSFRWIFQTIAILLLTAAVFLTTRYLTKLYIYRMEENGEGEPDLTVTESATNGKRPVTVCRVSLHHIESVRLFDFSDGGASLAAWKKFKTGRKRIFDYRIDFRPTIFLLVTVKEGGETLHLLFSHMEDLSELLRAAAEGYREDEE